MTCNIDFIKDWELKYQGAESRIYFGIHSNNRCVIKHRFSKGYRHPLLDKKLTKERTKRERRMIERIRGKNIEMAEYMPKVVWSNESTLLMTEITNCDTIYNFIEREPNEAINVAPLIGQCLAELHNLGIIHGDLTTSNLLLVPRKLKQDHSADAPTKRIKSNSVVETSIVIPIDFGLSTGSDGPEERAVDLFVLERALLSTHFSDSTFFNCVLDTYMKLIDEKTCAPYGKQKIIERLREVRARGRKAEYMDS